MARLSDNFDFFEAEDVRMAQAEARRPHCDNCHEAIYDEYAYRIAGLLLCESCVDEMKEYIEED